MSFRYARRNRYGMGLSSGGASFKRGIRPRYRKYNRRFGLGRVGRSATSVGRTRFRTYAALNARTGGLLGIEKKFLDIGRTTLALTAPTDATGGMVAPTSGCTGCYSAPAQGDGPTQRDGNKVVIVECNMDGLITVPVQINQTAADEACIVFIAMVQDMQTNGAAFTSDQVFTNPSAASSTACNLFRNMSFTSRFKILKMKKFRLQVPSLTFDGTNIEQSGFHTPFKMKWKGKMPVTFTTASTTADIANVTDNSIQVVAFCSNTGLAPFIIFNTRTRFYG